MKKLNLKPVAVAAGLALGGPAFAIDLDFSGSNIYMKFLDGDQRVVNAADRSGDTASGTDQGQWTEFELRIKARISKQVEAGVRLQSRSSDAFWTDFGGFGKEGATNGDQVNTQKWIKLRGAYVLLTPGYNWLDQALIGSSDWGQFDPFTVGKVRYIDRDNYNGLYFKGRLPAPASSWEFGRLSLPNYLQNNYGQGPTCCASDASQFQEAVYIGQVKGQVGPAKLTASYQWFNDRVINDADGNVFNGQDLDTFAKSKVFMVKGEASVFDGVDVKAAGYRSTYKTRGVFDQPWINSPKSSVNGNAVKLDLALTALPVPGLTLNAQYFNISSAFYSNTATRREADVLLTEGSEAAWHRWGDPKWIGGAARDYEQSPASAKCFSPVGALCAGDSGLQAGANGLVDNAFMDFDEPPNESIQGWKGITVVANYEVAKIPLSFEYTRLGYNYNGSRAADSALSNFFRLDNDRKTTILVARAGYVVPVAGGIELGAKYKLVDDKNTFSAATAADDLQTKDSGYTLSVGNQLFRDLYGQISYGQYSRKFTLTNTGDVDNKKNILSVKLAYNLAGFETGLLAQWVRGDVSLSSGAAGLTALNPVPLATGALDADFKQYRMKAFVKAIF
ncbi:MAG: hypothetical protein JNJ42_14320 [Burkholderiaceae bacterium]|nr:hypothetical protein [Burkholderiaceae bacterium]